MSAFKRNLRRIWDETGTPIGSPRPCDNSLVRRYVVRGYSQDGTGWGVWDKRRERYLKDREVAVLTSEQIEEAWTQ